jgi:rsbT antagonist protein RsbS
LPPVPILKQKDILIASIQSALSDAEWVRLSDDLAHRTAEVRARAVVIDVTLMDVMDSFATRILRSIASVVLLRGARTVIVGIQPDVAQSMVQLGLAQRLEDVLTALDLEQGLSLLKRLG